MATPGWPARRAGFPGIWLDRMKAYVNSRPSSAEPGTPVAMVLAEPARPFGDSPPAAVPNADGSVTLNGGFVYPGPSVATSQLVLTLEAPFLPARTIGHPVAVIMISGGPVPGALPISIRADGGVWLQVPQLVDGDLVEVWLDSVTYWPASG